MLDIPSISAVVAAIGVIVGVVFTVMELRNLVKTRQTEIIMRSHSAFGNKEYQQAWTKVVNLQFDDYNDFTKRYGPAASETPVHIAIIMVGMFFEGIGCLLHGKLIDIGLVDDLISSPTKITWQKMKPIAEGWRKQFNRPQIYEWFEYLYNELQKREQRLQQTPR